MNRASIQRIIFAAFALISCAALVYAENWPTWRGVNNNAVSKETKLPSTWSETKNVAWKLPMPGKAGSTPVVWGDRIFLTSGEGKDLMLLCVSTEGKQLWKRKLGGPDRTIQQNEGNETSASPSTDGKHVWTFIGTGDLACHDFEGNEIWKFNVQARYGKYQMLHGLHSTPLLHEDRLYISVCHRSGHWVVAIDKMTGKDVWKVPRKTEAVAESREAYASPCLWQTAKDTCLVILGADCCTGHSLKDGSEIWRLSDLNPIRNGAFRIITSPTATPEALIVPTCRGGLVVALKPGAQGEIKAGSPHELWRKTKGAPDVPTPLVHDGLLYLCRENGVVTCWEVQTGKQLWEESSIPRGIYRASPVYADGKVYVTARKNAVSVLKAGRQYEEAVVNTLPDEFTASPVISNGRIYLRGFNNLYAIQEGK